VENKITVEELEVGTIQLNKILETSSDRTTIERCKRAIVDYGALTLPVIGKLADGSKVILSGGCEFTALKETGIKKMIATTAHVPKGDNTGAKLSLLLSSTKKNPSALCEGMLLQEALECGASRAELGTMLGRSASWLSNRLALASRLDSGVRAMLSNGLIDARSVQEIARLPQDSQHEFAKNVINEGLPKSIIEKLVAGYNEEGCPQKVKEQIVNNPRMALARMTDNRRAVTMSEPQQSPVGIAACIEAVRKPHAWLAKALNDASPDEAAKQNTALRTLEEDVAALLAMIHMFVSPGKKGVQYAN